MTKIFERGIEELATVPLIGRSLPYGAVVSKRPYPAASASLGSQYASSFGTDQTEADGRHGDGGEMGTVDVTHDPLLMSRRDAFIGRAGAGELGPGRCLLRQVEHTFGDDVPLDLRGASVDRRREGIHPCVDPRTAVVRRA